MYKSRYRLDNGKISIAVDSMTGELVELINHCTGENLIKNFMYMRPQPFCLTAIYKDSVRELYCGNNLHARDNMELKAEIVLIENCNEKKLKVKYNKITDGELVYDISVEYTIILPMNEMISYWYLNIDNRSEFTISEVRFPCINGIYIGDTWEDDYLLYPYNAGIKIKNPVKYLSKEPKKIDWRWQNYRYTYLIDSFPHKVDETGLCIVEASYSGPLSMRWLDMFDDTQGIYFACHDKSSDISALRIETYGESRPGINFSTIYQTNIEQNQSYFSPQHVVAIHEGDWHIGADIYRNFKKACNQYYGHMPPKWFLKSPGLVAHYDFKYQNGGIVHKFCDLPRLYSEAKEMGLNHLLIAGWHKDGFDNGFPEYTPDPDLGSQEELNKHVTEIINNDGHISFYINSRLVNRKYKHLTKFIEDNMIVKRNNINYNEHYGDDSIQFACMCSGSAEWQEKISDTVTYLTQKIGIDGVYLDQLAMASPCLCFHPNHEHEFNYWNEGYEEMLLKITDNHSESPISIIYEGVSDIHGRNVSGQLISTFLYYHTGAFPEMYKYTFPNQILVDMLYPCKFQAMRPVHVGMASTDMINKAFVTGAYYWIYDLEEDNTFRLDYEQYTYLKDCITLRRIWLEQYGQGLFVDTVGLLDIPDGIMVKRFNYDNGILIACANKKNEVGKSVKVILTKDFVRTSVTVTVITVHSSYEEELNVERDGYVNVVIPNSSLSILYIS